MNKKIIYIIIIGIIATSYFYISKNYQSNKISNSYLDNTENDSDEEKIPVETEIASFSTPLLDKSSRQT